MQLYQWLNPAVGNHNVFVVLNREEVSAVLERFGEKARTAHFQEGYYYFLNTRLRTLTPMPFLALAFGGQYNGDSPIGEEIKDLNVDFSKYHFKRSHFGKAK